MKNKLILGLVLIITFTCLMMISYRFSTVDIFNDEEIIREIIDKNTQGFHDKAKIKILDKKRNKNEYFVLYQYDNLPYGLAIFEERGIIEWKRFKSVGGSNQSGRVGSHMFSQGMPVNQYENTTVIYGDNKYVNADYFVLDFGQGTSLKQKIEKDEFLYVYRFYSNNSNNGSYRFYDDEDNEITYWD